jgi:hypothetical protein
MTSVTVSLILNRPCPKGCNGCGCHTLPPCGHCIDHGEEYLAEVSVNCDGFNFDDSSWEIDGRPCDRVEIATLMSNERLLRMIQSKIIENAVSA